MKGRGDRIWWIGYGDYVIWPMRVYKGKGERNECKNYRCISLLNLVGKIYTGILIDVP